MLTVGDRMGDHAEVMGDFVLTQPEVNPVLSKLLDGGLTITALHNHLLRSTPSTIYMHVHGMGEAVALAKALRSALAASRTPTAIPTAAATETLALDIKAMDAALRAPGKVVGGTYQFAFPRAEQINEDGASIPPSIGLATAINFQPTTQGRAVATAQLKALERENRELRQANDTLRKATPYFAQAELDPLRLPSDDAAPRRNLVAKLRPFKR